MAGGIVGRAGAAARGADGRGSWYWRLGVPSRLAWPGSWRCNGGRTVVGCDDRERSFIFLPRMIGRKLVSALLIAIFWFGREKLRLRSKNFRYYIVIHISYAVGIIFVGV